MFLGYIGAAIVLMVIVGVGYALVTSPTEDISTLGL